MFRALLSELRAIVTTKTIVAVVFGGSLAYAVTFGGVYFQGRVRQEPIMIVDQDHTAQSRALVRMFRASDGVRIVAEAETPEAFVPAVQTGRAWACVTIPRGFQKGLYQHTQSRVMVTLDGANTLTGNVILKAARGAIGTFRARGQAVQLIVRGTPPAIALAASQPIVAEFRPLFNPTYSYGAFILLGLMCIALQQCTMMGAVACLGRSRQTPHRYVVVDLAVKTLALLICLLPISALALWLPGVLVGSPFRGDWRLIAAACVVATLVNIWCGFGTLAVIKEPNAAVQVLLCLSVPMFLVSGYTYPTLAEPTWCQITANLLPLTHYWHVARCVALIGTPAAGVMLDLRVLCAWLPVALPLAYLGVLGLRRRRSQ